jgi:hypothetical protein
LPSLEQTLLVHDLTLLRAIAEQAGVELHAVNQRAAATELAQALKQPEALELLLDRLAPISNLQSPINLLRHNQDRYPVAAFIRRFGDLRPLGPVALAREQPWQNPATTTEALYFNGLIGRAFMDSETGPQEFFYLPSDLSPLLPAFDESLTTLSPAQAIAPIETDSAQAQLATPILVDELVTLLAALQLNPNDPGLMRSHLHLPVRDFLTTLGLDLGLITPDHKLEPEKVKSLLNATRAEGLQTLANTWRDSKNWNDLFHTPTLRAEPGAWHNDPILARAFILKLCADLPPNEWRSLDSFVSFVHDRHPDFQRPAGDYDSWYIRDSATGDYVRGFENWDKVDGALIRYLLTGPLHWLGLTDLRPDGFRLTSLFTAFINNQPFSISESTQKIVLKHSGDLIVSTNVNRFDRFQAARIGEWKSGRGDLAPTKDSRLDGRSSPAPHYEYALTGNSLQRAAAQGITAKHILAFLRRTCEQVPEHLIKLIERWGQNGIEARAYSTTILKFSNSQILETLMRSPRTRRWLGEALGERAVEVKDLEKLREAMVEFGITLEMIEIRR